MMSEREQKQVKAQKQRKMLKQKQITFDKVIMDLTVSNKIKKALSKTIVNN